jgi:hypothetical protein
MRSSWYHVLALCLTLANAVTSKELDIAGELFLTNFQGYQLAILPVSDSQLERFELLAQYAGAAYCYSNVLGNTSSVECSAEGGFCPMVENAHTTVLKAFTE